jgi:hypothetical protein
MFWSEVLVCIVAGAVPSLLEIIVTTHEFQSKGPQPPPLTDSDNWKCPSAAEIARVVGGATKSDDDRSGASIRGMGESL